MSISESRWKIRLTIFLKWFLNAGFFYFGWLVCMHQANEPYPYPYFGPLIVFGILCFHFKALHGDKADFYLLLLLSALGTLVDSVYINIGMFSFKGGYQTFPSIAPLWITSIWALYAISINHSLQWLNYSKWLAAGLGAAGAISSYLAGVELGAADPLWGKYLCFLIVGVVWAIIVPFTLQLGQWLKKKTSVVSES